jgi:uncharacterized protein YoxC
MFGKKKLEKDMEEMKITLYTLEKVVIDFNNVYLTKLDDVVDDVQTQLNSLNQCFDETCEDMKDFIKKQNRDAEKIDVKIPKPKVKIK